MIKVGITGGIGSGKSIICRIFSELGVPIYEADKRAKAIVNESPVKEQVIEAFGENSYKNGVLNRDYIAEQIFNDFEKRELMNSIVHPVVASDYKQWLQQHGEAPFTIKEAALFFETGSYLEMDKMVLVVAELEVRVQRILKRDPFRSKSEVMNIIASQLPDDEKLRQADYVINNNGKELVLPQVLSIYQALININ